MNDRRLTPDPALVTQKKPAVIGWEFADLCRAPGGARDRQLLFGDTVVHLATLEQDGNCAYVQSDKDGYCGFVELIDVDGSNAVMPKPDDHAPTHFVIARQTQCYEEPDIKSWDLGQRSFGSQINAISETDKFIETSEGYIPKTHLAPLDMRFDDPATIAEIFLGTPYLWGGNTCWGIDCSGLVQAALLACGIPCPGDSDMQQTLGVPATGAYQRNDLLFWKGHVAMVVDSDTLIHANAASMSTRYEGITATIARIVDQGDGPVTAHQRIL